MGVHGECAEWGACGEKDETKDEAKDEDGGARCGQSPNAASIPIRIAPRDPPPNMRGRGRTGVGVAGVWKGVLVLVLVLVLPLLVPSFDPRNVRTTLKGDPPVPAAC